MAHIEKPTKTIGDLIDELDRILEDLLAIQRGIEKMENVQTAVSRDAHEKT
jgi:hypothetical protein